METQIGCHRSKVGGCHSQLQLTNIFGPVSGIMHLCKCAKGSHQSDVKI